MKRFFFSLIALSAAAIGCTQSAMLETPDLGGMEVSFSPYTGRTPESKATSIENVAGLANGGGFNVYCFLNQEGKEPTVYLDNEKVESKDNGSTWAYTNLIYWPTAEGSSLDFVAYSTNGVGKGLEVSEDGFTFTVANDIANQIDLLATAYQAGNTLAGGSSVTLKFYHLLSRVGFKIQASQTDDNRKIKITNLALKGKMPKVGTLTFADFTATGSESVSPVLSPSTAAKDYNPDGYTLISSPIVFDSNTNVTNIDLGTSGRYLMIMPHRNDDDDHYIKVTYAIGTETDGKTIYSTEKEVELDLPSDFTFVAGRAYEFVLQISTSKLSFEIDEQEWDEDDYDNDADKDNNQDFPLEPQDQNAVTLGSAYVTSGTDVKIPITVNKESLHSVKIQYIPSDKTWDGAEEIKEIEVKEYAVGESKEFTSSTFSSNTEYYYRACVKVTESSEETYYYPAADSKLSFITYAQIATPDNATDIEPFKCTLSASYTYPQGNLNIIAAGFCWNLGEATPTARPYKPDGTWNTEVYLNETKQPAVNGTITVAATQLSDGKKYTYRAYVINERGVISYSETRTFDTPVYIPDANGNDDPGTGDFTEGDEI